MGTQFNTRTSVHLSGLPASSFIISPVPGSERLFAVLGPRDSDLRTSVCVAQLRTFVRFRESQLWVVSRSRVSLSGWFHVRMVSRYVLSCRKRCVTPVTKDFSDFFPKPLTRLIRKLSTYGMGTTSTPTKKHVRHGAVCELHGIVHSRPKSSERKILRAKVAALHGTNCAYCHCEMSEATMELDRIVESCLYVAGNILPACKACNNARNATGATLYSVAQNPDTVRLSITLALTVPCRSAYHPEMVSALLALV